MLDKTTVFAVLPNDVNFFGKCQARSMSFFFAQRDICITVTNGDLLSPGLS